MPHDQDLWPAPPGTLAKNIMNARLGAAYIAFTIWAKERKIQRLDVKFIILDPRTALAPRPGYR